MEHQGVGLSDIQQALRLSPWPGPATDPILLALGTDFFERSPTSDVFPRMFHFKTHGGCAQCGIEPSATPLRHCSKCVGAGRASSANPHSCRKVRLCSVECMRAFWPAHRKVCPKLAQRPNAGNAPHFADWLGALVAPLQFALPSAFGATPTSQLPEILMLEVAPSQHRHASYDILVAETVDLVPTQRAGFVRKSGHAGYVRPRPRFCRSC